MVIVNYAKTLTNKRLKNPSENMKNHLIKILFIALIGVFSCTTAPIEEIAKTESFSKFWGFLKYYHPTVATGEIDWDNEFLSRIDEFSKLQTKEEINKYYLNFIHK